MISQPLESDLIRAAAAGDRVALSQLLLLHYNEIERHVALRLANEPPGLLSPEDALQETFFRAAQALPRFENAYVGSFCPWLKTVATNLIKDAAKRRRRERRAGNPTAEAGEESRCEWVNQLAGDSTSPSRCVVRHDNVHRLQSAMTGLPIEQREVIRRHYLLNESFEQIATAMDRSKDAIRGICYRAKKNLRFIMGHSSKYFSK
jgi:RNA polymerase sigma-70 factor (ECF subfamily)